MKDITDYIYNPVCPIQQINKPYLLKKHTVEDIEKYAHDFKVWEANRDAIAKWRGEVNNVQRQLLEDFRQDCVEVWMDSKTSKEQRLRLFDYVWSMVNDYYSSEGLDYILREVQEKYEKLMELFPVK